MELYPSMVVDVRKKPKLKTLFETIKSTEKVMHSDSCSSFRFITNVAGKWPLHLLNFSCSLAAFEASQLLPSTTCQPLRCHGNRRGQEYVSGRQDFGYELICSGCSGRRANADIHPGHVQLCIQLVQLHKVFFVGDTTSTFPPPVVNLPVLYPPRHTCNHKDWNWTWPRHRQEMTNWCWDSPLMVNLLSV